MQTYNLCTNVQKTKQNTDSGRQTQVANFEQKTSPPAFGGMWDVLFPDKGYFNLGINNLTRFRDLFFTPTPKEASTRQIDFIYSVDKVDREIAVEYAQRFTDAVFEQAGKTRNVEDIKKAIKECTLEYLLLDEDFLDLSANYEAIEFGHRTLANPGVDFQNRYLAFVYMRLLGDNKQKLAYQALVEILKEDYKPAATKTEGQFCRASDPVLKEWKSLARFAAVMKGSTDTIAEKEKKTKNGFPVDNLRQAMKRCGGEDLGYRQIYTRPELAVARGKNYDPGELRSMETWIQGIYPNLGRNRCDENEALVECLYGTPASYLVDPLLEHTLSKRLR